MLDFIKKEQLAHIKAMENIDVKKIEEIAITCNDSVKKGGKIIVFGNGGSASDAQHFAAELIGRYKLNRKSIASIALNTDTSAITAIGNDFGYEEIFARQVEGLGNSNDLVVAISTSGNSKNIILALEKAKGMGIKTVLLSGKDGGKAKDISDIYFLSPSDDTPRIQEIHIFTIHIICDYVEKHFLDA